MFSGNSSLSLENLVYWKKNEAKVIIPLEKWKAFKMFLATRKISMEDYNQIYDRCSESTGLCFLVLALKA